MGNFSAHINGDVSTIENNMQVHRSISISCIVVHYPQGQGHSANIARICVQTVIHCCQVCVLSPRSQCAHSQTLYPDHDHISLLQCWIMIFHSIVVHNPRVCHYLNTRSYRQGQGRSLHINKIWFWAITFPG